MSSVNYIPRKDAEFLQWTNNFVVNLGQVSVKAGIPSDRYDQIIMLRNQFIAKYEQAENVETRTVIAVQAKNEARDALEHNIRQVVKQYLIYNESLTDLERTSLGLPIHKTSRTPSPVAATYPDYDIDSSIIRRLSIHYHDASSASKAKPVGQHGVEIRWNILDAQPESVNELARSSFDTRSPFTLEFDENQRGKTVYFCLCWENTRGEKGPWSEIMSAIVP